MAFNDNLGFSNQSLINQYSNPDFRSGLALNGNAGLNNAGDPSLAFNFNDPGVSKQRLGGFSQGIKNFSLGAEAFTGLAGVYQANKLRKRGDKQFGIEREIIDRNLANESLAYNDQITQRAIAGLAFQGIDPGDPRYQEELARLTAGRFVDGSPVAT